MSVIGDGMERPCRDSSLAEEVWPLEGNRLLDDAGRITLAEVVQATGANRNTLKVKIAELVDSGLMVRHGRGRGVYYTRGDGDGA